MKLLLLFLLFIPVVGMGQKIKPYTYKRVDTLLVYKDAEIIIYRNKTGIILKDTIYFPLKRNVKIEEVDYMLIDEDRKLKASRRRPLAKSVVVWMGREIK